MDIEFIKKTKNEIEFKIKNQEASFFDIVINIASSKKDVDFVSKKKADNLAKEFTFYLRTSNNRQAKDVLLECISEAEEKLENIISNIEKNILKIKK